MTEEELLERVTINQQVMVGKPIIRGTRIPVELIVLSLAQGLSEREILEQYPRLQIEDIRAALMYAAQSLSSKGSLSITASN